jgi:glyoxylase-like metal-dependent hydrolase (beta-lactamase superfamily II)
MLLQPITEQTYYIPGSNNLGVITTPDHGAIVIDTGIDKETGRLIRKALDEAKLKLQAIICTHHHADHIGGNDFLVRNIPGIEVLAPPLEAALIEHPILEPVYLSMGAQPIPALQTKWLMAKGVAVTCQITAPTVDVAGVTLEVIPLVGHSLGQIGIAYDGVGFVADGFFGPAILAKHGVPYAQNVAGQLRSLDLLAARPEAFFLPGHGDLATQEMLGDALRENRAAIERTSAAVQNALHQPAELTEIGRRVQQTLNLHFGAAPQYVIFLSAISAHLAYLQTQGVAQVEYSDAGLLWQAA